jgi:hypothetical protein
MGQIVGGCWCFLPDVRYKYKNHVSKRVMLKDRFTSKDFYNPFTQRTLIALLLCVLLLSSCAYQHVKQHAQKIAGATVTIDLSSQIGISQFMMGVTRTQLDEGPSTLAGHRLIGQALSIQNVFIYGWGTDNPEPFKGYYDWSSLDERVEDIESSGSQVMLSLCCAPDWMKGSSDIEAAPLPQYFGDFARLAAQVAERYSDVTIFQVWNELKGFQGDYLAYTALYNDVYDAVKAVRPDAQLGGPYLGVLPGVPQEDRAVYTHWLNHKQGGEYILLDGGPLPETNNDEFGSTIFSDWINWIRKQPHGGTTLAIGWAEIFTRGLPDSSPLAAAHYNATFADDIIKNILLGVSYALQWGTSSPNGVTGDPDIPETMMTDRGQPTPIFYTMKDFKNYFGPGTPLYHTTVSSPHITVLASRARTMLVNHLPSDQTVIVNGTEVDLTPYQVLTINTPGQ